MKIWKIRDKESGRFWDGFPAGMAGYGPFGKSFKSLESAKKCWKKGIEAAATARLRNCELVEYDVVKVYDISTIPGDATVQTQETSDNDIIAIMEE